MEQALPSVGAVVLQFLTLPQAPFRLTLPQAPFRLSDLLDLASAHQRTGSLAARTGAMTHPMDGVRWATFALADARPSAGEAGFGCDRSFGKRRGGHLGEPGRRDAAFPELGQHDGQTRVCLGGGDRGAEMRAGEKL
jgi:hypothetical protein